MIIDQIIVGAIVLVLAQAIKGIVPNRIMPVVAGFMGLVIQFILFRIDQELGTVIVAGFLSGLTAVGAYDAAALGIANKTINAK